MNERLSLEEHLQMNEQSLMPFTEGEHIQGGEQDNAFVSGPAESASLVGGKYLSLGTQESSQERNLKDSLKSTRVTHF